MNGILIVDKPEGLTSAEVVRRVKRVVSVKVGHLGTLDPFASGVLPLCLGEGTKIAQFLNTADKTYDGIIQLGEKTDTGDPTGRVTQTGEVPDVASADLAAIERRFTGEYRQVPPMYSALKREGVPLYRLARQGIEVERESRLVRLDSLRLAPAERNQLRFEVSCSKGTYVRVLAEDIAAALGTVGHLKTLRRTRFGAFELSQAVELSAVQPPTPAGLLSIREALSHLPAIELDARSADAVQRGQAWVLETLVAPDAAAETALLASAGRPLAVVVREGGRWHFGRVLCPA